MSASSEGRVPGRWARVWRRLRGPRYIDLPIRLLALIMGLTGLLPGAFETTEPLYVGLTVFAYVLIVLAPFFPVAVTLISAGLSIVFLFQYPDLENMFPEALILSAGVLLSYMRWWVFGFATLLLFGYQTLSTPYEGLDGGIDGLIDLGYGWVTTCLLGLAAGIIEARIRIEISRREAAARENERALETLRMRFTSDTHDTISHSLSTEAAIIKSLGRAPQGPGSDRMIAELAMVNAEANKRLRQLVGRLRTNTSDCTRIQLPSEAQLLISAIEDGCAAGGVELTTTIGELPEHASRVVGEHFTAFVLELATNVIRYSTPGTGAALTVSARFVDPVRADLRYTSVNESDAPLTTAPRSLSVRAHAVGGDCTVGTDSAGRIVVEVVHPLEIVETPTGAEAQCVQDDFAAQLAEAAPGSGASAEVVPGSAAPAEAVAGSGAPAGAASAQPTTSAHPDHSAAGPAALGVDDSVTAAALHHRSERPLEGRRR